jgi:hypothetical protein
VLNNIEYISPNSKIKKISIKVSDYKRNSNNDDSRKSDSKFCIECLKVDPVNKLLLCSSCKFNLTHINCIAINENEFHNFICTKCLTK